MLKEASLKTLWQSSPGLNINGVIFSHVEGSEEQGQNMPVIDLQVQQSAMKTIDMNVL